MPVDLKNIDELAINTIRTLSIDGVQKANSGHPGMPLGCAPMAYLLFAKVMNHNPQNPKWFNRDRFVLSAGHGSMLLYSSLHLSGYAVTIDDLKNFRQWASITPGHPENTITPGVETTTGPLGQGVANAVGMAIAQANLAARYNKDDVKLIDHYIYGICSDGDLMEGISHEAASLAGHLKLGRLIFFYDNNGITIDGKTELAYSENTKERFTSYGWHVQSVEDGNDLNALEEALENAKQVLDKPSIIIVSTHIGYGSPNKQDTADSHGSPLGADEIKLTKQFLSWDAEEDFFVPTEIYKHFSKVVTKGIELEDEWNANLDLYQDRYPKEYNELIDLIHNQHTEEYKNSLPKFTDYSKTIATRAASGQVLNAIAPFLPGLIGGSADLTPSNNTSIKEFSDFNPKNYAGRYLRFGIREHGMASILNGMSLYTGLIPYGATFLIFSDYLRPAIRLAALSGTRPILIFTHDSIGLGEDGPTHQPVEHLASIRAIPKTVVIRPCDANETVYAWQSAIEHKGSAAILVLSRQALPVLDRSKYADASNLEKGAYILKDSEGIPEIILMASGSEVHITLIAAEKLESEGKKVRVVSFPSWELFEKQSAEYKESVLPKSVTARVSVEAGVSMGWCKYTGSFGANVSVDKFGASAPDKVVFEKYGFTVENVYNIAITTLGK